MTKIQENELSESAVRLQENRKCDIWKLENSKVENSNFENSKFEYWGQASTKFWWLIEKRLCFSFANLWFMKMPEIFSLEIPQKIYLVLQKMKKTTVRHRNNATYKISVFPPSPISYTSNIIFLPPTFFTYKNDNNFFWKK